MGKTGRNDPCPCGSGKKYKKCCLPKESVASVPAQAASNAMMDARLMAQRLMGQTEELDSKMDIVFDKYTVDEGGAAEKIKRLGTFQDGRVSVEESGQKLAEIDLNIPGEANLMCADPEIADVLKSRLETVRGVRFVSRTEDQFEPLDEKAKARVSKDLLDFKKKFFRAWPDEKNERLAGKTPREAMASVGSRKEVEKLLAELESKEKKLPRKERFDFKGVRKTLGL